MTKFLYAKLLIIISLCCLNSLRTFSQEGSIITTARESRLGLISYAAAVTSSGISAGKYVDGYVKKMGSNNFIFPVGDAGVYRPFAAFSNGITGAYFFENPSNTTIGNEVTGGPFPTGMKDPDVGSVSQVEFWDINGSFPGKITLTWNAASGIGGLISGTDLSKLFIVGWDGSKWVKVPSVTDPTSLLGGSSSTTTGSITSTGNVSPDTYKVYSFGASAHGALPVTLIGFEIKALEKTVQLTWSTSSEINSDFFEIEKSSNSAAWERIGTVKAKGSESDFSKTIGPEKYTFVDIAPFTGQNFYRLRMVDRDGSFAYSKIRNLDFGEGLAVKIFPNPVSNLLFVTSSEQIREISIYDLHGKLLVRRAGGSGNGIGVQHLASGTYIVGIEGSAGRRSAHKIIISR